MSVQSSGATNVLFVTVQYLRENSVINDNVDGNLLQPVIRTVHDKYLHPILGSQLYYSLQQKVITNTLTGNYLFLMNNYIVPFLLHYSTYESIPFMAFKFRNKGIQKQSSPDSTPAELGELTYVRDSVLATAQFYGERLVEYLCANQSSFPEYRSASNGDISPSNGDYFNGIHIPGSNRSNNNLSGLGLSAGQLPQ